MMSPSKDKKIELIIHIGMGKTGTSSIQRSLFLASDALKKNKVSYWGYSLELCPIKLYDWQSLSVDWDRLNNKTNKEAFLYQLTECFKKNINYEVQNGAEKIIWSNERLIDNPDFLIPALKEIQDLVNLKIICYFRNPADWAGSAYAQWGIKHKTYPGKIKTPKEFFEYWPVDYSKKIILYLRIFKGKVSLYNYSALKESIVFHFSKILKIDLKDSKENSSISNEELYLRFLFNNEISRPTLPSAFDKYLKLGINDEFISYEDFYNNYLNTVNKEEFNTDGINEILLGYGEESFEKKIKKKKVKPLDKDMLIKLLLNCLIRSGQDANKSELNERRR